ncbi:DinB family protein [Caldimonas brevitalea]|nr:DinB family protein [Caldimonas brevitalea]
MSDLPASLVDHYAWMARYNAWFNERLYASALALDDAERKRDRGDFFGSIHGTLNHLLLGDKLWLGRFAELPVPLPMLDAEVLALPPFTGLGMQLFEDFETLRLHRAQVDHAIQGFVAQLTPELVSADFSYTTTRGATRTQPCWRALSHFFNHQTHHRGQVTTLLMQAGIDPGDTDLLLTPEA